MTEKALQLRSLITSSGELVLSLEEIDIPSPGPDEVLVRIEAAPINPSDLGGLFAAGDLETAKVTGTKDRPVLTANIPERMRKAFAARADQSMPVGNEGAGTVVAGPEHLKGKRVAFIGGAAYGTHRTVSVDDTLLLEEGTTAAEGASAFVNPLTALGMLETLKREGHGALVHTAAASALGQMVQRLFTAEGIPLVNIVRKQEQTAILRGLGAKHIVSTGDESFTRDLGAAVEATGATLAFDAIGGGKLPSQILSAMEAALQKKMKEYSRYGSTTHKQVYIYGGLDLAPTEVSRSVGMAWSIGGWLVFSYLGKLGPEVMSSLKKRVAKELKTTFATTYAKEISLADMLSLDVIREYAKKTTGNKYLVKPNG